MSSQKPETYDDIAKTLGKVAEDEREIEVEEPPDDDKLGKYKFDLERQENFLRCIAEGGTVADAARVAGISRSYAYTAKKNSDRFARLWEEAEEISYDKIVKEARNYAMDGKVTYEEYDEDGNLKSQRTDYSEKLLIRLLEARRPDEFDNAEDSDMNVTIQWEGGNPADEQALEG